MEVHMMCRICSRVKSAFVDYITDSMQYLSVNTLFICFLPLSTVATSISLAMLLTDVPSVDYTLIL